MKKRVFIAINLAPVVKEELAILLSQLKKINPQPVVHYVKAKSIHLTLHFLGYLDEQQLNQTKIILKKSAKDYGATELATGQIGAFPDLKKPRVIFLSSREVNGEGLINFQKKLGQNLEKIGFDVDHRPWHPHLTLARIVGPCEFKTDQLKIPKLEIPVNSIELMESQLKPFGAEYKIIENYTLRSNYEFMD